MAGVRLKRLKINKYRNVAPGTELVFNDGFNVLLGKNGTGKTTLLELIAAAVRFDFGKLRDEPFSVEYELAFSTGTIVASMRNEEVERSPIETSLLQVRNTDELGFSATLRFSFVDPLKEWVVCADSSSIWIEDKPTAKLSLRTQLGDGGPGLLLRALQINLDAAFRSAYEEELWGCEKIRRFDEALDMFADFTGRATWIEVLAEPSTPAAWSVNFHGVISRELTHAVVKCVSDNMSDSGQGLTIPRRSLPFLRKVAELFGFRVARMEMRLEGGQTRNRHKFSEFRFMFENVGGAVIPHEKLSYGQKRLLFFLYYTTCNLDIIIADELVNGLHYEWIEICLKEIRERQSFLTSQNPVLLDMLPFASAEEVQRTFVLCAHEVRDGQGQMVWKNMTEESATAFFRAYETQALQVSEILRTHDLW